MIGRGRSVDIDGERDDDRTFKALRGPWAGTPQHLDAPYWQTSAPLVEHMLELAEVGVGDHLIDLGCGDGRIVIAAAQRGASGLGVDIDPARIAEAETAALDAKVERLTRFRCEDLFETRIEAASVVTLYLVPHVNSLLARRLRTELAVGSRVLSHGFPLRDWVPRTRERIDGHELFLWIVE